MSEWKPIETAPRDGTHVLLYTEGHFIEGWWGPPLFFCGDEADKVAHSQWMIVSLGPHGCGCCSRDLLPPKFWRPLPLVPVESV